MLLGLAGLSGAAAVALIVAATHGLPDRAAARSDPQALSAYAVAVRPVFAGAGEITELEMKPSIAAFDSGQLSGGDLAARAAGWQLAFTGDRTRLGGLTVPASLAAANRQFESAMSGYDAAALWLQRAGEAPDPNTARADVTRAVSAAQGADALFDRASRIVQTALHDAGLPADPDLPGTG